MEFLLKFDVHGFALRRHQLQILKRELEAQWDRTLQRARIATNGVGFIPTGLPPSPVAEWPPAQRPFMQVTDGSNWLSAEETLERLRNELNALNETPIPTTDATAQQTAADLAEAEGALDKTEQEFESLFSDARLEQEQLAAIDKRLNSLRHDLQEYKDEQRLRERDSFLNTSLAKGECRVCGQAIKDTLAAQTKVIEPMPLLENIAFLNDQVVLFEEMRIDASRSLEGKQQALISLKHRMTELRAIIRTQKETLRSSANSPSAAAIRKRLIAEDRIRRLETSKEDFDEILLEFKEQARAWAQLQTDLLATKADNLTQSDRGKLNRLRESFTEQLSSYSFRSFSPSEIQISYRHFRPIRDDNDLWGMSASDTIRTIWAYLVGLLEIARKGDTNHPGLLILDEPRQQSADRISFGALLKRVAAAKDSCQQVIFATSEEEQSLKSMLEGVAHDLKCLPERVLQPLPNGSLP